MSLGIEEEDAAKLNTGNKIIRCVVASKKSHNDPLTSVEELENMVQNWSGKALHTALNIEIHFRKFSFTTVKSIPSIIQGKKCFC